MTHQIPHNLAGYISPTDQNAPRTHGVPFFTPISTLTNHQSLTAFVRPCHNFSDRLCTLGQALQHSNELNLEQLNQILMATVADQRRLVPNGLEIYFLP